MLKMFLIFLLTDIHFDGAHDSHGHTLYPGIGRMGAGAVSSLIVCLFCTIRFSHSCFFEEKIWV